MPAVIARSARKHGISDEDMLHALRNPVRAEYVDEGFTMFTGPAQDGTLLEIGVVDGDPTRSSFTRTGPAASTCRGGGSH